MVAAFWVMQCNLPSPAMHILPRFVLSNIKVIPIIEYYLKGFINNTVEENVKRRTCLITIINYQKSYRF